MARRWTVVCGLGVIVAIGCRGDEPVGSLALVTRDSAGITMIENGAAPRDGESFAPFALDSVADWRVGEEEGEAAEDPRLLDGVRDAHVLHDGSIVIANGSTSQLRRFDARGTFVAQTGRRGQGPGEFEAFSIGDIFGDGDTVLVADAMLMRTHVYDRELQFLETRRFTLTEAVTRPYLRGVFADGDWLVLGAADGGRLGGAPGTVIASDFALYRYDRRGAPVATLTRFPGRPRYVNEARGITHFPYVPLTSEAIFAAVGDELAVLRGPRAELEFIDRSGRLARVVRWDRAPRPAAELWPEYRRREVAGLARASERDRVLYGAFYARALPLPEYAPLYTAMKVDDARRVWLMRFRMPYDSTDRVWDVVDSDGRLLGAVHTPASLTVFRVRRDAVLGLERDSLGVERVVRFPIQARR